MTLSCSRFCNINEQIPVEVLNEVESALDAAFARSVASKALCDALKWITASGTVTFVSSVKLLLSSHGYLITVSAEVRMTRARRSLSICL